MMNQSFLNISLLIIVRYRRDVVKQEVIEGKRKMAMRSSRFDGTVVTFWWWTPRAWIG